MTHPHFEAFLAQAVNQEQGQETGLGADELYGLYTSWCLLSREEPQAPAALWEALKEHQIRPEQNDLGMKGPAAADYIMASAPDLV
jgi:hypothetical protein